MAPGEFPVSAVFAGAAAVALPVAAAFGYLSYRRYRARRAVAARVEALAAEHLQDVILPDGNEGWFHVDYLLLTPVGIVVIDLRDVSGMIFGSEQMTEWTVMHKTRRFTFPNPLGPLYDRMAVVRLIAGDGVPVVGRVVFTDRGEFPKGHPEHATRLASLAADFPAVDRAQPAPSIDAYRDGWHRLCAASSPSSLRRR